MAGRIDKRTREATIRNMHRDDRRLNAMAVHFWSHGGICCPSCGCPGYFDLVAKQERRLAALHQKEDTP